MRLRNSVFFGFDYMGKNNIEKKVKDFIAFMIGLILIIWEISIYRKTIIPIWIPLAIIGVIGLITAYFDYKNYSSAYTGRGKMFFVICQNTVAWGFSICSIFMLSNYYLANSATQIRTFNIESKSSMSGGRYHWDERKPLIRINYDGQEKELVFSNKYFNNLEKYQKVSLVTQNGLYGFDILIEQQLF